MGAQNCQHHIINHISGSQSLFDSYTCSLNIQYIAVEFDTYDVYTAPCTEQSWIRLSIKQNIVSYIQLH